MTNKQKLELICLLASENMGLVKTDAENALDTIFTICHPSKKCPHWGWDKDNEKLYKELKKDNIL